jgi:hypothetical protein
MSMPRACANSENAALRTHGWVSPIIRGILDAGRPEAFPAALSCVVGFGTTERPGGPESSNRAIALNPAGNGAPMVGMLMLERRLRIKPLPISGCHIRMGTGLFVNARRGRTFERAEIETLTDEELQDLLRRASPSQVRSYCTWLVHWIRAKRRGQNIASTVEEMNASMKKK